jgi:hypothetical protein
LSVTEAGWKREKYGSRMLSYLLDHGGAGARKLRLMTAACCREVWDVLPTDGLRRLVELTELSADGAASEAELLRGANDPDAARWSPGAGWAHAEHDERFLEHYNAALAALAVTRPSLREMAVVAQRCAGIVAGEMDLRCGGHKRFKRFQARCRATMRDIFGNPFRPAPAVDLAWLAWRGGVLRELARAAYENRRLPEGALDPARLAALADALEDAGCTDAELLGHLRGPGSHVRGCWAVDLVLGKS